MWSIVGSASLLGRELRDVLAERNPGARTRLIGADEVEEGTVTEQAGEAVVMTALDEDNLGGSSAVFLAGSESSTRKALAILSRLGAAPAIIDLTHVLEADPRARLRAPILEPPGYQPDLTAVHVIAHPAAIALALFLSRLSAKAPVRRTVVHIFEPASERGQRGIDELQQQTVNLLTFKELPKEVFDEQLGFNVLAQYGSEAPEALNKFEMRIERHLASLLAGAGQAAMPSLRLIQVPVFHGHSFSVWAEFEKNPGAAALEEALATAQIDVRGADLDAPTVMGIAGQSGLAVGGIRPDRNDPRASWFWIVADNLRIAAENAVAVATSLAGGDGTVQ